MKKIVLTLIMCLLGLLGTKAQETKIITINKDGNNDENKEITNTSYFPYSYWYNPYSVTQMIYVESQFKDAAGTVNAPVGKISDIAFVMGTNSYGDNNAANETRKWRVYIKNIKTH